MKTRRLIAFLELLPFLLIIALGIILASNCAGPQVGQTPQEYSADRTYLGAQSAYLNAWSTYHKYWLALPDTDPRKKEWVEKYHTKFVDAGNLLIAWGDNRTDPASSDAFWKALDTVENILIELQIRKEAQ